MSHFFRKFFIIFTLLFQLMHLNCMQTTGFVVPNVPTEDQNYFDFLPEEMIVYVLTFLPHKDIKLTAQKLDRKFYRICNDKALKKPEANLKKEIAQKIDSNSKKDLLLSKIEEEGRENQTTTLFAILLDKDLRKIFSIENMAYILTTSINMYHTFEAAIKILQINPNLIEKIENHFKRNKWFYDYHFFFKLLDSAISNNQPELTKQLLVNSPKLFTSFKTGIIGFIRKLIYYAKQAKIKKELSGTIKIFDEKVLSTKRTFYKLGAIVIFTSLIATSKITFNFV